MLDLRHEQLPNCIEVEGKKYKIKTSFRLWIGFHRIAEVVDILALFEDLPPLNKMELVVDELKKFYVNPNSTPNVEGVSSSERIIDYIEDGEYIFGSFLQVYGVDLLAVDMHWWVFQALFRSLPDNCKIKEIMQARGWSKNKEKDMDKIHEKNKNIWKLPNPEEKIDEELLEEINDLFYNC